ncbi:MAG: hypothetical protein BAJATHORv1_30158 [Candidatus Thorarchaeota archaeon]|nr:MAG: hypothetical protein BAJATHORv1_30158 [Candidatus Thorarchaeota archaeon]
MTSSASINIPELLKELLRDLSNNSPILGAAILSQEGLPLESHFHRGLEEATIAAMVAGIYSTGEQTVRELRQGNLRNIIIEGDMGTTIVLSIPGGYLLCVTAPENAKLGLIFNDAKRVAREASRLIQRYE